MPTGFSYPCKALKRAGIIHKGGRTVYRSCRPANTLRRGVKMIGRLWDVYVDIVDRVIGFVEENFTYLAILFFIIVVFMVVFVGVIAGILVSL